MKKHDFGKNRSRTVVLLVLFLVLSLAEHGTQAEAPAALDAATNELSGKKYEAGFRFCSSDSNSLALWEGHRPVYVYNHGIMSKEGVPSHRNRSTYLHPVYGLDGEVLTDDFPRDHYHHRGVFWAWPHVMVNGRRYDLWELKGVEQRFERWLTQQAGADRAVLGVENGWFVEGRKIVREVIWIRAQTSSEHDRSLDLEFSWVPVEQSVGLRGAEGKSYGGLTMRFAPCTNVVITTPLGQDAEDLHITRLPWADFSAVFGSAPSRSGAAIFISPTHPDYPPEWLTRHYGVLCVGWPGVQEKTFQAGEVIRAKYRIWIHRGGLTPDELAREYSRYASEEKKPRIDSSAASP